MKRLSVVLLLAASCTPEVPQDAGTDFSDDIRPRDGGIFTRPDSGVDPHLLPCVEDVLEDNDEAGAASPVPISQDVAAASCGGDPDWFQVAADVGCSIDARIAFDASYGDLDLHLFSPAGVLLAASTTAGAQETVQAEVDAAGAYLVRVTGATTAKTQYTLRVEVVCAAALSCPADDPYEENDDDAGVPAALQDGDTAAGIICPADADHYAVAAPPGCVLDARLVFDDAAGDLDLDLLIGDRRLDRSAGTSDLERILKTVPPEGGPVLRVFGFQDQTNVYELAVDATCPTDMGCPTDDPYEENDDGVSAVDLDPPDGASGIVCGTDEDWYDFFPTSGCTVRADLDFVHADGDLDLKLLEQDGTQVGSSTSTDDDESIEYLVPSAGRLRVRIYGFAGAQNRYGLTVAETCP